MLKSRSVLKVIKVFISSPYSIGSEAENVRRQMDVANELINNGFVPFIPLLYHFQHMVHPQDYEVWLQQDKEWLKQCDCVLRLRGESKGADLEVELAKELGILRFYDLSMLIKFYKDMEKKRALSIFDKVLLVRRSIGGV